MSLLSKGLPNTVYRPPVIYNKAMFYLDLKGYARFKETAGEDDTTLITIAILDQEHRSTILTWLNGSVLTAAMQMKNRFALHASALRVNNRLYLF